MFEHTSRYYNLETREYITPDGRKVAYKLRRFLPQGQTLPLLQEVTIIEGDRLDLITFGTLGDPLHFWQVCDANNTMNPEDLTAEIGQLIRIPTPQV
ncbi:hypothetical protein [Leptolyngbya sp. FACHB-17]|uniref:hypothetical protein n=1 Tax=unclassified Leptolyngbya TaxID=2650499 RepID=UPI001680FD2E|nr:hypothetical protein [Leptolyngbya sp. FACHB-17]MBD2080950.1 hypothetical protein [Leptolyngbya sp. FACHB-17]